VPAAIREQLDTHPYAIERAAGAPVSLFRPPYGERTPVVDATARALGLVQVLWSTDSADSRAGVQGIEPTHADQLDGVGRNCGERVGGGSEQQEALRRGGVTAVPALAAYVLAARMGGQGQTVAFTSIVATQLTQTVELGRSEGRLAPSVAGAVIASAGLLATAVLAAPLRSFLGLAAPTPASLLLIGGAAAGAVLLSRVLARLALPAMPSLPPPAPMPAAVGGRSL